MESQSNTEIKDAVRPVKQVIVFRKDLLKGQDAIRKGKFAGQVAHASLAAVLSCFRKRKAAGMSCYDVEFADGSYLDTWFNGIFTKVVVSVPDDTALTELYERIKTESPDIPVSLITDCGRTEFHDKPTNTCIGVGPYYSDIIDKYTKDLPLL